MKRIQELVNEFLCKKGEGVPAIPLEDDVLEAHRRLMWCKLLLEETLETMAAAGVKAYFGPHAIDDVSELEFTVGRMCNTVLTADGLGDVIYVATAFGSVNGLDLEPLVVEVCMNNLAKFGPGHTFREDGKLIKPPGHKPPDLKGIIDRQRQGSNPKE